MTEHIVIVRKAGRKVTLNLDVPSEWWENIWDLAPVPQDKSIIQPHFRKTFLIA